MIHFLLKCLLGRSGLRLPYKVMSKCKSWGLVIVTDKAKGSSVLLSGDCSVIVKCPDVVIRTAI